MQPSRRFPDVMGLLMNHDPKSVAESGQGTNVGMRYAAYSAACDDMVLSAVDSDWTRCGKGQLPCFKWQIDLTIFDVCCSVYNGIGVSGIYHKTPLLMTTVGWRRSRLRQTVMQPHTVSLWKPRVSTNTKWMYALGSDLYTKW